MCMRLLLILVLVMCFSCIEPYEFVIEEDEPALVVEGYISNVSYDETVQYPSDGRYFAVKLGYTSDVTNRRGIVAANAIVHLEDETGRQWAYTELADEPGKYLLLWKDFEAVAGRKYKLKITLPNEETYESEWETLPPPAPMGDIGFTEVEKQVYQMEAGEQVVVTIRGVNVYVEVPEQDREKPVYYRWDFDPTWIYIAPLARSSEPDYKCWASNNNYLSNYVLQMDNRGGYRKELFFMEVDRNERVFEELSVLVVQQSVSEAYYYFWKEMQEQVESGGLFETPPYNLQTNLKAVGNDRKVSGYFGVVNEEANRWYFNKEELSYNVQNTLRADCEVVYGPGGPAPSCLSCLSYTRGEATNIEPEWWK
jgi:hypothetical protein